MEYITTTELRTKSKELMLALKAGKSVKLLHRSRVIAEIEPESTISERNKPKKDQTKLAQLFSKLELPEEVTAENWKEIYRKRLMEKYGKYLS